MRGVTIIHPADREVCEHHHTPSHTQQTGKSLNTTAPHVWVSSWSDAQTLHRPCSCTLPWTLLDTSSAQCGAVKGKRISCFAAHTSWFLGAASLAHAAQVLDQHLGLSLFGQSNESHQLPCLHTATANSNNPHPETVSGEYMPMSAERLAPDRQSSSGTQLSLSNEAHASPIQVSKPFHLSHASRLPHGMQSTLMHITFVF